MSNDFDHKQDWAIGQLVAGLARGIILCFLVLMLLRQFIYPNYGISAQPHDWGNWFFLVIASQLLLPWNRWSLNPKRLQLALSSFAILTLAMYLYIAWNIGFLGWWLLPLFSLWCALVIFAFELDVQQQTGYFAITMHRLNFRQLAAVTFWLLSLLATLAATWFGVSAEPHEAHLLIRCVNIIPPLVLMWLVMLRNARTQATFEQLKHRATLVALYVTLTEMIGLNLGWKWLQDHSLHPVKTTPSLILVIVLLILSVLVAKDQSQRRWYRVALTFGITWSVVLSRVTPQHFIPTIPFSAGLLPLLFSIRWQWLIVPTWLGLLMTMSIVPDLDKTQFILHTLTGTAILLLNWWLLCQLDRLPRGLQSEITPKSMPSSVAAPDSTQNSRHTVGLGLLVSLMVASLGVGWIYQQQQTESNERAQVTHDAAEQVLEAMINRMNEAMQAAHALESAMSSDTPTQAEFRSLAKTALRDMGRDVSLQWAPEGVLRYIEPFGDSELALGLDLLNDPDQGAIGQIIRQERLPRWKGPFVLKQGHLGIVYAIPKYTDRSSESFRGFVQTRLAFPGSINDLLERSRWLRRQISTTDVAIWLGTDPNFLQQVYGATSMSTGAVRLEATLPPLNLEKTPSEDFSHPDKQFFDKETKSRLIIAVSAWPNTTQDDNWVARSQKVLLVALLSGWFAGWLLQFQQSRRAMRVLQAEYAQMRHVLDNSNSGYVILEADGNCLWFNRRLLEIMGFGNEQLQNLNAWQHQNWIDWGLSAAAQEALQNENTAQKLIQNTDAFGHSIDIEVRFSRVQLFGRWHLIGQIEDLKELNARQKALAESEANFRMLFDDAPDACLITSLENGRILACNQAAVRMLQADQKQIIGEDLLSIYAALQVNGRKTDEFVAEQIATVTKKGNHRFEFRHRRFDGEEFWAEITLSLGYYHRTPALYYSIREIGEIIAAKQLAEAANVAKSRFLATMSHEIRTPLNAIIGMTHTLGLSRLDADQQHQLQTLKSASRSLLALINDILDLAKIEAGEIILETVTFDLSQIFNDLSNLFENQCLNKGLSLRLPATGPELDVRLEGDVNKIRQILINLIGNAIKFTTSGSVQVEVKLDEQIQYPLLVRFMVSDTGIGIAQEVLDRLFQPFTQADASTTRLYGGSGLGLSLVKQLAERMGGQVGVQSMPGKGSTFWCELPLCYAEDARRIVITPRPTGQEHICLPGLQVLVVDDSDMNLAVCERLLSYHGAIATLCQSGEAALATLDAHAYRFDLVLMDIQMPVMDGCETTRRIRLHPLGQKLPVLALTAGATQEEREQAFSAGMEGFLAKPIEPEELINKIRQHVESNQARQIGVQPRDSATEQANNPWQDIAGIDIHAVRHRLGGNVELFNRLIDRFLADAKSLLTEVDTASAADNWTAVIALIHRLRGNSGNIGAMTLAELLGRMELAAETHTLDPEELNACHQQLTVLRRELADWRLRCPPPIKNSEKTTILNAKRLGLLNQQLTNQNLGAFQNFKDCTAELKNLMTEFAFAELNAAMEQLDFTRAAQLLNDPISWKESQILESGTDDQTTLKHEYRTVPLT